MAESRNFLKIVITRTYGVLIRINQSFEDRRCHGNPCRQGSGSVPPKKRGKWSQPGAWGLGRACSFWASPRLKSLKRKGLRPKNNGKGLGGLLHGVRNSRQSTGDLLRLHFTQKRTQGKSHKLFFKINSNYYK